jgi:hypothetical protein
MIRYYCDRCEIEVEGQAELSTFSTDVGDIATSAGWRLRRELCNKCLEEAKDLLNKFFAKPAAARRRTA